MIKKLVCLLLVLATLAMPALALKGQVANPEELPYIPSEGGPNSWAVSEIEKAAAAGIIPQLTGNPGYQDSITREQFAELVVRTVETALGTTLQAAPAGTFTDSSNQAVLKASQAAIVNGVGQGKFKPSTTTNREQIATMVARAVQYAEEASGKDITPAAGSLEGFTDQAAVSTWAVESVGLLAANGIMNGTSNTRLSPKNTCTVEQSILLCYRVYTQLQAA